MSAASPVKSALPCAMASVRVRPLTSDETARREKFIWGIESKGLRYSGKPHPDAKHTFFDDCPVFGPETLNEELYRSRLSSQVVDAVSNGKESAPPPPAPDPYSSYFYVRRTPLRQELHPLRQLKLARHRPSRRRRRLRRDEPPPRPLPQQRRPHVGPRRHGRRLRRDHLQPPQP